MAARFVVCQIDNSDHMVVLAWPPLQAKTKVQEAKPRTKHDALGASIALTDPRAQSRARKGGAFPHLG